MSGSIILAGAMLFAAPLHVEGESLPVEEPQMSAVDQTRASLMLALESKVGAHMSNQNRAELAENIAAAGAENGIDPFLVLAVISVESEFKATAHSKRGAQGLMQLKNSTAYEFGEKTGKPMAELGLFDKTTNISLGSAYLRACRDHLGSWSLALAAYNWGPAKVRHALHLQRHLPNQMRAYEYRVAKRYQQFANAAGLDLAARPIAYGPSLIRDAI